MTLYLVEGRPKLNPRCKFYFSAKDFFVLFSEWGETNKQIILLTHFFSSIIFHGELGE